ncbi:hypothetical protein ACP70R_036305 [Stipagrostis hirtigluma subsp. patula]
MAAHQLVNRDIAFEHGEGAICRLRGGLGPYDHAVLMYRDVVHHAPSEFTQVLSDDLSPPTARCPAPSPSVASPVATARHSSRRTAHRRAPTRPR